VIGARGPNRRAQDFLNCVVKSTLEKLKLAERYILEIKHRIAHQRELIAELEQASWDAAELLRQLQGLEAQRVADRERLLKKLGKASD